MRRATILGAHWVLSTQIFLSTLSLRRATCYSLGHSAQGWHFYPRSPCGERPGKSQSSRAWIRISIHALLAESDGFGSARLVACAYFYPRSPCGERRWRLVMNLLSLYFYPRSPCGERLGYTVNFHAKPGFLSTLSLRRATLWASVIDHIVVFLSTLSLRRAT